MSGLLGLLCLLGLLGFMLQRLLGLLVIRVIRVIMVIRFNRISEVQSPQVLEPRLFQLSGRQHARDIRVTRAFSIMRLVRHIGMKDVLVMK